MRGEKILLAKLEGNCARALGVPPNFASSGQPTCTNCGKVGYIDKKCWAKDGGAEGKVPKFWCRTGKQTSTQSMASNVTSLMASFNSSMDFEGISTPPQYSPHCTEPIHNRQSYFTLNKDGCFRQGGEDVDSVDPNFSLVSKSECDTCSGNIPYSTPLAAPTQPALKTYIDSGASAHCWVCKDDFIEYEKVTGQGGNSAIGGDAGVFRIHGVGTVEFAARVNREVRIIQIQNVKHTPSFRQNLVSLSTLDAWGFRGSWVITS